MNQQIFTVSKVLNNNVIIAKNEDERETVVIHKGIGFGKRQGDQVPVTEVGKIFILKDQKEQDQYKKLLPFLDESFIVLMNDIIHYIQDSVTEKLDEHIHIGLTDHIAFAMSRIQKGLVMKNPFLQETKTLYPKAYETANHVVKMINKYGSVKLPKEEIGFIALHIHSAVSSKSLLEINQYSQLIHKIIAIIEDVLEVKIDKDSLNYMRLVRHLRFTIERVKTGEKVEDPVKLTEVLQKEYPICYNLSWKVIKIMQEALKKPVFDAEAVYLSIHLQRLSSKSK